MRYERTVARDAEAEIEVRRSRFRCRLVRVASEAGARIEVDAIRRARWEANHHCVAWRIGRDGALQRTSDDGEPAGTAGMPMLAVLERLELTDTLAVVSRYFGGVKLGAGGLIRAYGSAVTDAVRRAGVVERRPLYVTTVAVGHADAGRIEHGLRTSAWLPDSVTYNADEVVLTVHLERDARDAFHRWIGEQTGGRSTVREAGIAYVEVPVVALGH